MALTKAGGICYIKPPRNCSLKPQKAPVLPAISIQRLNSTCCNADWCARWRSSFMALFECCKPHQHCSQAAPEAASRARRNLEGLCAEQDTQQLPPQTVMLLAAAVIYKRNWQACLIKFVEWPLNLMEKNECPQFREHRVEKACPAALWCLCVFCCFFSPHFYQLTLRKFNFSKKNICPLSLGL